MRGSRVAASLARPGPPRHRAALLFAASARLYHRRMIRRLTEGEKALARTIYGDAIDLEAVEIRRRKWFPLQPRRVVMAPRGHIHFHPHGDLYRDDFSAAPIDLRGLFVHELCHVWQAQRGLYLPLRRHPFCRYGYVLQPGRRFERYGIEQQAEIVRHAYLLRAGAAVPGAPPLARYESLLPFRVGEPPACKPPPIG